MSTTHRSSPSGPAANRKFTILLDHGTVTAVTVAKATATLTGARTTDLLSAVNSIQKTGLGYAGGRVSGADEIEISLVNPTAGNITSGTVTYTLDLSNYSE